MHKCRCRLFHCTDTGCILPDSLLEGRRRIVSAIFRASNARSGNPASQARLDDNGWCSGVLATNIFDPYIEIDFGRNVLFTSVATQGVTSSDETVFIERYRIEVAGEDGPFQYITPSTNSSQLEPAVSIEIIIMCLMVCIFHELCPHTDIPTGTE